MSLVRDIQIHPRTHDLILATHGRGIFIIDDIRPMRNLSQEIVSSDLYLFENAPMKLTMGDFGGGGFPATNGWIAGNPASVPPIQYYLKDRISSGKVVVEIYDQEGKLVQSIPASNRKGINKVYWNQRIKPPKVAVGGTKIDAGGFLAPTVMPGTYTVKLKAGEKELSKSLQVVHNDAEKGFSLQDREQQYKTGMELYRMHEKLGVVVEDISARQKMIREQLPHVKSKKVKALLEEYNTQLEKLRSECLATRQKSIFADEERLRERITDVYASVVTQEAAPSNLQLQRVTVLQQELANTEQSNKQLSEKYFTRVKQALIKEGLLKEGVIINDGKK